MLIRLNIYHESIDLMGKLICWRNKQSLLFYYITPNGRRKRVGPIQQKFCSYWTAKCDGPLRNGPKSDPILWKHSINIMLEFNSLKKSIKVDLNRSKISLLYFYNAYVNLCEKKKKKKIWQKYSFIHTERMPLLNFIIYCKKNRHSWRLSNSSKTFVNQWESRMDFCKLSSLFWK